MAPSPDRRPQSERHARTDGRPQPERQIRPAAPARPAGRAGDDRPRPADPAPDPARADAEDGPDGPQGADGAQPPARTRARRSAARQTRPNTAFRALRGGLSPGEFASAVRRAAREIGEQVSCDARYIGRVESGEIQCPNYAYERVFRHMFPGRTLRDLGFAPREVVRGRRAAPELRAVADPPPPDAAPRSSEGRPPEDQPHPQAQAHAQPPSAQPAFPGSPFPPFPFSQPAAQPPPSPFPPPSSPFPQPPPQQSPFPQPPFGQPQPYPAPPVRPPAAVPDPPADPGPLRPWSFDEPADPDAAPAPSPAPAHRRPRAEDEDGPFDHGGLDKATDVLRCAFLTGGSWVSAVEQVVRRIRLLDDQYGADAFYPGAVRSLRTAYRLLDEGAHPRRVTDRLRSETGELALSVGWLSHDGLRPDRARSAYLEALATARTVNDRGLEAHAFSCLSFLARDLGRPREALYAARAGQHAARHLGSPTLSALLALREAGGLAGLGDRSGCERALVRADRLFAKGRRDADPEWMSFFGEAEFAGLTAQCWSVLGDFDRAVCRARRAVDLQDPHFVRNTALYTAELVHDLTGRGAVTEAAHHGHRMLESVGRQVDSSRIRAMLATTVRALREHRRNAEVAAFLDAYDEVRARRRAVSA